MTLLPATAIETAERTASAAPLKAAAAEREPGAFAGTLAAAARQAAGPETLSEASAPGFVHQHSRSGELQPLQKFESFVLRSFIENMLPSEDSSFFGTGTAGKIWKSMLAERIGDEMAASGGIGIADLLKDHEPAAGEAGGTRGPAK